MLQSSQVLRVSELPPPVPEPMSESDQITLVTPQKPHDMRQVIQYLDSHENLGRGCRLALLKASKAIGELVAHTANHEAIIQCQNSRIEGLLHAASKRKAIPTDPNTQFANIEGIHEGMAKAAEAQAQAEAEGARRVQNTANSMSTTTMQDCLFEFQL